MKHRVPPILRTTDVCGPRARPGAGDSTQSLSRAASKPSASMLGLSTGTIRGGVVTLLELRMVQSRWASALPKAYACKESQLAMYTRSSPLETFLLFLFRTQC
jgi:hypothetical protein